jgi:hypothetical protein
MRTAHSLAAFALCIIHAAPAATAPADVQDTRPRAAIILGPEDFASDAKLGNGCWARLYHAKNYSGHVLTLVGPVDIDYVQPDWGFAWDPRYESLIVGPNATLTVYDDPNLRDKVAVFRAGQRVPDLNEKMGVFRSLRSMKVSCS